MNQDQPFCKKHNDYMIQLICLDYSNEESYKMCKKCKKELWQNEEETLETKFKTYQEQFEKDFFTLDADQLEGQLFTKLRTYCNQLEETLKKELQKIPIEFMKSVAFLRGLKLDGQMQENLQQEKERYLNEYHKIKQSLTDIIINQMDLAENTLFQHENLIEQTLYQLPDNSKIKMNVDGYNLLRKFEQLYIDKFRMLNEDDLIRHKELKLREVKTLKQHQKKVIDNSKKINKQVEKEIDQQKSCMLAKLTKYQQIYENNVKKLTDFLSKWENFEDSDQLQIQDIDKSYLKNIVQFNQLQDFLERQAKEQIALQSRICHLGKIDIKISLESIQKSLCINYIPIVINQKNQEVSVGHIEGIKPPLQDAVQIRGGQIDPRGHHEGRVQINFPKEQGIAVVVDNKIKGDIVIEKQNQLFKLDLIQYFNKNTFDYQKIVKEDQREEYFENNKLWNCVQSNTDLNNRIYTLTITQFQQGTLIFKGIKLGVNQQIDETNVITIESQPLGSQISQNGRKSLFYYGTVNNQLRYHGRGVLTIGNIIRKGTWKNGLLDGEGEISKKMADDTEKPMYQGEFLKGKQHGKGTQYYPEDYQYDGEFVNGLREGKGTISKKTQNGLQVIETTDWKQDFPTSDKCSIF